MEINLEEELFCTKYELKTLSDLHFQGKAERWVKDYMSSAAEEEHINRYKLAVQYVRDKDVLEMACGSGYGCKYLIDYGDAKSIVGVDLDAEAVRYGNYRYYDDKVTRFVDDATEFQYNKKFDVITCFETIEHIPNYDLLVKNLHRNLKKNGVLLISTPITRITNKAPQNIYHVIEWNFYDFQKLFENLFILEEILIQNVIIEVNKWKIPSLLKKLKNRIFPEKIIYKIMGKNIEEFTNQYDMNKCIFGYQILILRKK